MGSVQIGTEQPILLSDVCRVEFGLEMSKTTVENVTIIESGPTMNQMNRDEEHIDPQLSEVLKQYRVALDNITKAWESISDLASKSGGLSDLHKHSNLENRLDLINRALAVKPVVRADLFREMIAGEVGKVNFVALSKGISNVLNISPGLEALLELRDRRAIKSDWEHIGNDLKKVMKSNVARLQAQRQYEQ